MQYGADLESFRMFPPLPSPPLHWTVRIILGSGDVVTFWSLDRSHLTKSEMSSLAVCLCVCLPSVLMKHLIYHKY